MKYTSVCFKVRSESNTKICLFSLQIFLKNVFFLHIVSRKVKIYEIGTWFVICFLYFYLLFVLWENWPLTLEQKIHFKKFCNSKHFALKSNSHNFALAKDLLIFDVFFPLLIQYMFPAHICEALTLCLILP